MRSPSLAWTGVLTNDRSTGEDLLQGALPAMGFLQKGLWISLGMPELLEVSVESQAGATAPTGLAST